MSLTKIPPSWRDFRIVETVSGEFTGQVIIDDPIEANKFGEKERVLLSKFTKEFLEEKLGCIIRPYSQVVSGDKRNG